MIIPDNVKCSICLRIFCCEKCRQKHEVTDHMAIVEKNITNENLLKKFNNYCNICNNKPLIIKKELLTKNLNFNICAEHFPLHCKKCLKIFYNLNELRLLKTIKCFKKTNENCFLEEKEKIIIPNLNKFCTNSKINYNNKITMGTNNDNLLETIPEINATKELNKDDDDNVFAMPYPVININKKDNSLNGQADNCENNSYNKTKSPSVKLVRSTSTPMQLSLMSALGKSSLDSLSTSSCQMSSINNSSTDSDSSPINHPSPPQHSPSDKNGLYKKSTRGGRPKLPISATPLRQVMSKSIQRAMKQIEQKKIHPEIFCKKYFDSSTSMTPPLDLRTSPVIRRTKSDLTNYSIKTPNDIQNINASYSNKINNNNNVETKLNNNDVLTTPRILGVGTLKKAISFTNTPDNSMPTNDCNNNNSNSNVNNNNLNTPILSESSDSMRDYYTCEIFDELTTVTTVAAVTATMMITNEPQTPQLTNVEIISKTNEITPITTGKGQADTTGSDDVWYTPYTLPHRSYSYTGQSTTSSYTYVTKCNQFYDDRQRKVDEKKLLNKNTNDGGKNTNKLWSLVSSVINFGSGGSNQTDANTNKTSLIKRCVSFAGFLGRPTTTEDELPIKRRRTSSVVYESAASDSSYYHSPYLRRKRKIQGRQPIDRMKKI